VALRLVAVSFDAVDPARVAVFWAGLLGRDVVPEAHGALVPGDDTQVGLRFVASATPKVGPNRLHLHLTSSSVDDQQASVEKVLDLGGRHIDIGQRPEEGHIVLADPEGNELCVIEPGNSYLAGCGLLGEVTCEGSREVGMFWRDVLGWPLVWDRGEQTVVQSPLGGTKVAWDGEHMTPKTGRNRQRLAVGAPELLSEVRRLVALGATEICEREGSVELADPDGNEFSLEAAPS
jgi:catechol 2,3-dioxygenase-like lactoylglutathione lyase family enzyme